MMNTKLFFSAIFIFSIFFCNAQLDDKFYQPSKEMKPLEFTNSESIAFPVENDTITAVLLKPESKNPKKNNFLFSRCKRKCYHVSIHYKTFGRKWISGSDD